MMVSCGGCVWAGDIDNEVRLALSQENKEIVNILVRRGLGLDEFCYCKKLGYIESVIMKRECSDYMPK